MAGDWIKITHELPDKPEVLSIAGQLSISRFEVVGRLHVVWRWFDQHTKNGHADGVTSVTLAVCLFGDAVGTKFIQAMIKFGWMTETDSGVFIPNFDYHISETAKTRAMSNNRKKKQRSSEASVTHKDGETSRSERDKSVTREEKNREEKILKPSSVESEGGAGISSPDPITPAPLSSVNVFPMSLDWSPSIEFQKNIPPHLNDGNDLWLKDLANFCLYRSARGEKFTQAQWELHFYKDLEANKKHRGQA